MTQIEAEEREIIDLMRDSLQNQSQSPDGITCFAKNVECKLREISDNRTLLIVQNEIDQILFKAQLGIIDERNGRGSNSFTSPYPQQPYKNQNYSSWGSGMVDESSMMGSMRSALEL